jgi:5'/3'-nucleotidase SurE
VSVIIPDRQRSWIGKAHMVDQAVSTAAYWPPATTPALHDPGRNPSPGERGGRRRPWVLVDSTPASCSQLGLNGPFFRPSSSSSGEDLPPIDLVISGPNFGRNTTAVFALSSGTLGAALEATLCGYRSIALSFAYFRQESDWNDPEAVLEACGQGVRVCEYLAKQGISEEGKGGGFWKKGVLYSVNVPVKVGVRDKRVVWTRMLGNAWTQGGCFEETTVADDAAADAEHAGGDASRRFRWAPKFQDVYDSVQRAGPGSDGWAVKEGETSVTALRANFMHAAEDDGAFSGEITL